MSKLLQMGSFKRQVFQKAARAFVCGSVSSHSHMAAQKCMRGKRACECMCIIITGAGGRVSARLPSALTAPPGCRTVPGRFAAELRPLARQKFSVRGLQQIFFLKRRNQGVTRCRTRGHCRHVDTLPRAHAPRGGAGKGRQQWVVTLCSSFGNLTQGHHSFFFSFFSLLPPSQGTESHKSRHKHTRASPSCQTFCGAAKY